MKGWKCNPVLTPFHEWVSELVCFPLQNVLHSSLPWVLAHEVLFNSVSMRYIFINIKMYLEITMQMSAYRNPSCELNFIYISISIQTLFLQPDIFFLMKYKRLIWNLQYMYMYCSCNILTITGWFLIISESFVQMVILAKFWLSIWKLKRVF